jgi:malate dehydrogenase (oxaloacetate-decarboxylating)
MPNSKADAASGSEFALRRHAEFRGKVQMMPKCPIEGLEDFAVWYTPGVAAPCRAIAADPAAVYAYTNKGNTIAIVSDGSRVLGLGDIGPEAGLPVMEGKALLFKYLGGVDAVPICVRAKSADEIVAIVEALEPSFGGINLEDIAQPKCFEVLDRLRARLKIPVWHDDQQGTAVVVLAGLMNALAVVGKKIGEIDIAMIGIGAANVANYRILKACGVDPTRVVAVDTGGVLGLHRADIEAKQGAFADKWRVCQETNGRRIQGGVAEALRGADVCIAFSTPRPGVIEAAWVATMARGPIVFACANPEPEIWPQDAKQAGARIVATGRSDLPNQLNNSLAFPGIFRGVLDIGARSITDSIAIAAAKALSAQAQADSAFGPDRLLPSMTDWRSAVSLAVAVGKAAAAEGLARTPLDPDAHREIAERQIMGARAAAQSVFKARQEIAQKETRR